MKKLMCGLVMALGLSFFCHAQGMKISQYPNTNNLAGTNLFLIAIVGSPGTNMNISYAQLSNLLAGAIGGGGGAQVWTNDGTIIFPLDYTKPVVIGTNAPHANLSGLWSVSQVDPGGFPGVLYDVNTPNVGSYVYAFQVSLNPEGTNEDASISLAAINNQLPMDIYSDLGGDSYVSGMLGKSTANVNLGTCFGVVGRSVGGGLGSGLVGISSSVRTNLGVLAISTTTGNRCSIAGYFETPSSESHDFFLGNAVIVADSFVSGFPLFLARTNNGTVVASLGSSGVWTNQGTVTLSNATPAIPTAAALGAGGYWTGNSNGFLVTVYSLDGSTTVMKVLAP